MQVAAFHSPYTSFKRLAAKGGMGVFQWATKAFNALSAKAIVQRLDKRRLQHELDTHRLFLLTSYHGQQLQQGGDGAPTNGIADQLAAKADELKFQGMRAAVASNLNSQLLSLASLVHSILLQASDPAAAARQRQQQAVQQAQQEGQAPARGRGFGFALGSGPAGEAVAAARAAVATAATEDNEGGSGDSGSSSGGSSSGGGGNGSAALAGMGAAALAAAFKEQAGFCLRVAPSSIAHAESGVGLWIEGKAGVGQIVALYPGVAYAPLQYCQIPGYPKIDRKNPYIIGRFDGVVLDAKPWGQGPKGVDGTARGWPVPPANEAEAELGLVEGRHPLALGHFANHPSPPSLPNVMVAAFDFRAPGDAPHFRPYIPNVLCHDPSTKSEERHAQQGAAGAPPLDPGETVTGLVLVATRDLEDEEVFLNYRLSPHVAPPDWYIPVDAEEDRRRWA